MTNKRYRQVWPTLPKPYPIETLPNAKYSKEIATVILAKFREAPEITADEVHDEIMRLFPGKNPSLIGQGFRLLAREHKIVKVGHRLSRRIESHHREIAVWRLDSP